MKTYELDAAGKWIQCLRCGLRSHNPNDVAQRYCGKCHIFHEDQAAAEQAVWESWLKRIVKIVINPAAGQLPETYEIDLECGHHVSWMTWPWSNKLPCTECLNEAARAAFPGPPLPLRGSE